MSAEDKPTEEPTAPMEVEQPTEEEKKEEKTEETKEEKKEEEPVVEEKKPETAEEKELRLKEEDAPKDTRAKLAKGEDVMLNEADSSLNAYLGADHKTMHVLTSDGWEKLYAGMRATYGIKGGRYYFEVKFLDVLKAAAVGVSTAESGLFPSQPGSIMFDYIGEIHVEEEKPLGRQMWKKWTKGDVLGVLINCSEDLNNKQTVTLYVNGVRAADPVDIPESLKGKALFPTVITKGCTARVNFGKEMWKELPFKARMVQDAAKKDLEKGSKEVGTGSELVCVMAADPAAHEDELKAKFPNHLMISSKVLGEWAQKNNLPVQQGPGKMFNIVALDHPMKQLAFLDRPRKYVMAVGSYLTKTQRAMALPLWHGTKKTAVICPLDKLFERDQMPTFADVALPTKEEGFDEVMHLDSETKEAEVTEKLAAWQKNCRLKARVDDLKVGTWFSEFVKEFEECKKFMAKDTHERAIAARKAVKEAAKKKLEDAKKAEEEAKKKEEAEKKEGTEEKKEGEEEKKEEGEKKEEEGEKKEEEKKEEEGEKKEEEKKEEEGEKKEEEKKAEEEEEPEKEWKVMEDFTTEDWMLAELRVHMHALLIAFKEDAGAKEADRESFPPMHYWFYSKLYCGKPFNPSNFACKNMDEVCELVPEVAEVDSEGFMKGLLPKDGTTVEMLIEQTEEARVNRQDRVDAGDENAALKFTARSYQAAASRGNNYQRPMGGGKGGNNFQGNFHGNGARKFGNATQYGNQQYGQRGDYNQNKRVGRENGFGSRQDNFKRPYGGGYGGQRR